MRVNRLAWYGLVMCRDDMHLTKRVLNIKIDGRIRPNKRWIDSVKYDLCKKGVNGRE